MKKILSALFVLILATAALLGLAACGEETSFSVNFIVDGEVYATVTPQEDGSVKLPSEPTKEGYTFAGWFLDEDFKREFNEGSLTGDKLTDNVSVYAKWTAAGTADHTHSASDWITDVEATCAKEGAKHKECTECGALLESAKIEKRAHTPADAVKENEQDSTCAAVGHYDSVVYCSVCHEEISREEKEIAKKTTHTPAEAVRENERDSTCSAVGHYDSVVYCSVCGEEISREEKEIAKKTTHTPAKAVRENVQDSTCSAVGHYDSVVYCSVCGEEIAREEIEIAKKTQHNMQNGACTYCGAKESSAGLEFELNDDGESYTVVGIGTCTETDIVIDTYNNKDVTSIDEDAFA